MIINIMQATISCAVPFFMISVVTAMLSWKKRDRIKSIKASLSGFEITFDKSSK